MVKKYVSLSFIALSLIATNVYASIINFNVKFASDPGMPSWVQMYSQLDQNYSTYRIIDRLNPIMVSTPNQYNRTLAVIDEATGQHRLCYETRQGSSGVIIIHFDNQTQRLSCTVNYH